MQPTDLDRSILRTLFWFSQFDLPLTHFEIYKWLLKPKQNYSYQEILAALDRSDYLREKIHCQRGFFSLKEKELDQLIRERQSRFLDAWRKFGKLRRAARVIALFPGVRAIAAANTLSFWNTKPESDIDLFIITRAGSIWSTRFLAVAPFIFLKARPKSGSRARFDQFCFSFFASEQALNFEHLQICGEDCYLASWITALVPIVSKDGSFSRLSEFNHWTKQIFPNARLKSIHPYLSYDPLMEIPCQPKVLEPRYCELQERRFPESIKKMMNQDSRVVVNDNILKFHDQDRRAEFQQTLYDFESGENWN